MILTVTFTLHSCVRLGPNFRCASRFPGSIVMDDRSHGSDAANIRKHKSSHSGFDIIVTKSSFVSCGFSIMLTSSLVVLKIIPSEYHLICDSALGSSSKLCGFSTRIISSISDMYHLTQSRSVFPKCELLSPSLLSEVLHRIFVISETTHLQ